MIANADDITNIPTNPHNICCLPLSASCDPWLKFHKNSTKPYKNITNPIANNSSRRGFTRVSLNVSISDCRLIQIYRLKTYTRHTRECWDC